LKTSIGDAIQPFGMILLSASPKVGNHRDVEKIQKQSDD
jgi:hypothetical protein